MGSFDTIISRKQMKCPLCNGMLSYSKRGTDFQTKDLLCMFLTLKEGRIIKFRNWKLIFTASGNTKLNGLTDCRDCHKLVEADIIIRNGIITKITNLRLHTAHI